MDLLKSYESNESSSEEPGKSLSEDSLLRSDLRSVYLVTYSQADITKFPTRENFASAVVYAFSQLQGKGRVVQWCCCREKHKNGGEHYHLALKLDRNERWLSAKEFLLKEFGISVHFSNKHHNYFSAHQKLILQRIFP